MGGGGGKRNFVEDLSEYGREAHVPAMDHRDITAKLLPVWRTATDKSPTRKSADGPLRRKTHTHTHTHMHTELALASLIR